jgi:hypothetical protein
MDAVVGILLPLGETLADDRRPEKQLRLVRVGFRAVVIASNAAEGSGGSASR